MRLEDLSIPKERLGRWPAAVRCALGGFLLTLGSFEGRAPLGVAFLAAARGRAEMLFALLGSAAGAVLVDRKSVV